ncbi:Stress response protein nst1 [Sporothrix epigloea]|uniref:Stress response protein NST1 n=1 Tax=Sporothrix epigloea TaxID=1892477 RepID=A0ABP0E3T3_9PEZI
MKGNRQNHPPPAAESTTALSPAATASNGTLPTPTSPSAKGTAKYTNKDGSKFITVPKAASPVTAISPSVSLAAGAVLLPPPTTQPQVNEIDAAAMEGTSGADGSIGVPAGNRKKAKRRAKAAARERKAEDESDGGAAPKTALPSAAPHRQGQNGEYSITLGENSGNSDTNCTAATTNYTTKDDDASDKRLGHLTQQAAANGSGESKSKKSKKKKKKKTGDFDAANFEQLKAQQHQPAYRATSAHTATASSGKEKIWNTNSHEERQRIKEFWLDLSEDERKSLVKVEKDTILKKMKEQQKMTCSCHFCGRKRTAIEEELEGLYDSYYEELEQFANDPAGQQQQQKQQRAPGVLPPSGLSGRFGLHGGHAHGTSRGHPGYAHSHSHGHPPAHSHTHVHSHPNSHAQLHAHHHAQSHPASASSGSHQPSHGRIVEHADEDDEDEDDELDEEYIDDEEEEELEDEDEEVDEEEEGSEDDDIDEDDVSDDDGEEEIPPEEIHRDYASDFFNFGNSLQVHGGILTVADDLLKNDGRKFIEMMEQLAERRMAREEDAKDQDGGLGGLGGAGGRGAGPGAGVGPYGNAPPLSGAQYSHNHHIPSEEDYGPEDEDDEEYGSEDEEYDEEEDSMTEEQRMEEGRRMFQIFAARMFEQRVLTAYREKVSKERQQRLFDELDEEKIQQQKRDEKRAKDAQKRKDKAAQKKKALADEKARKEAEKELELAARRAEDARREDEQKRKAEEKRKKREAQRKADEEERLRKEAERQRRINEQKDQERRALEAKERDKKRKEESRQRDKEDQEKRERESRERKEKQERDKRDKEARARANEAKERQRQEERAAQKAQPAAARAAVSVPALPTVPVVPVVPSVSNAATLANSAIGTTVAASPVSITLAKRPVSNQASQSGQLQPHASSALPQQALQAAAATSVSLQQQQKVTTPMRPRQLSQQGIGASSAVGPAQTASQHASPHPITPVQSHNTFAAANKAPAGLLGGIFGHPGANGLSSFLPPTSPLNGANRPITSQQPMYSGISGSPTQLPYPLLTNLAPGFGGQLQQPFGTGIGSGTGPLGTRGGNGPQGVMPILSSSSSSSSAINSIGRGGSGGGFGSMTPHPPPGFGGLAGLGPVDSLVTPIGSLQYESIGIAGGQHSRQASGGAFDTGSSPNGNNISGIGSAQPIARPTPIGRPGSTVNGQRSTFTAIGSPTVGSSALSAEPSSSGTTTDDDLLGSRALLDDSDFAMDGFTSIRRSVFPGRGSNGSVQPPPSDLTSPFMSPSSLWAPIPPHHPLTHAHHHQQSPLHAAPGMHQLSHQLPGQVGSQLPHPLAVAGNAFPPSQSAFGPPPGISAPPGMGLSGTGSSGWGMSGASGAITGGSGVSGSGVPLAFPPHGGSLGRGTLGRLATLRKLLCQACKDLAVEAEAEGADGTAVNSLEMLPIDAVKARVFSMAATYAVGPVLDSELDQLYDTEGNSKNGGGNFETKRSGATRDTKTVNGAKEGSLDDGAIVAIRWIPDAQSLLHRFGSGSAASNGNGTSDVFGNPFGSNHAFGDFGGGGGFGGYNSGPGGISNGLNGLGGLAGLGGIGYFNVGDSHGNTAPIGAGSPSSAQR